MAKAPTRDEFARMSEVERIDLYLRQSRDGSLERQVKRHAQRVKVKPRSSEERITRFKSKHA